MKKGLMVFLALLVVGSVMFAEVADSPVTLTGVTSGTTSMEVFATNSEQTAFTLTQTGGLSGSKIDLTVDSAFRQAVASGVKIGDWIVGSNHAGNIKLNWYTDGGFKATVGADPGTVYTVPYKLTIGNEDPILAEELTSTVPYRGEYAGFEKNLTSGVYEITNSKNFNDIMIYPKDNTTVYVASGNYVTTISFIITTI